MPHVHRKTMSANVVTLTVRFILNDYLPDSSEVLSESVERHFQRRYDRQWRYRPQIEEVETDVELFGERESGVPRESLRFTIPNGGYSRSEVLVTYVKVLVEHMQLEARLDGENGERIYWDLEWAWEDGKEPEVTGVYVNYEFEWNLAQGAATVTISSIEELDDDKKHEIMAAKLGTERFRRRWGTTTYERFRRRWGTTTSIYTTDEIDRMERGNEGHQDYWQHGDPQLEESGFEWDEPSGQWLGVTYGTTTSEPEESEQGNDEHEAYWGNRGHEWDGSRWTRTLSEISRQHGYAEDEDEGPPTRFVDRRSREGIRTVRVGEDLDLSRFMEVNDGRYPWTINKKLVYYYPGLPKTKEELACDFSSDSKVYPVQLNCGHVYCASEISYWFPNNASCPKCRENATNVHIMNEADIIVQEIKDRETGDFQVGGRNWKPETVKRKNEEALVKLRSQLRERRSDTKRRLKIIDKELKRIEKGKKFISLSSPFYHPRYHTLFLEKEELERDLKRMDKQMMDLTRQFHSDDSSAGAGGGPTSKRRRMELLAAGVKVLKF